MPQTDQAQPVVSAADEAEDMADLMDSIGGTSCPLASVEVFNQTAERAKELQGLSNEQRLELYGLFKQASIGDVNVKRPWGIDMVGAAKWLETTIIHAIALTHFNHSDIN